MAGGISTKNGNIIQHVKRGQNFAPVFILNYY